MRKQLIVLALLLSNAFTYADTFRVRYSMRGVGRAVSIQADSSSEARRTVMDLFPGVVVTNVRRLK